MRKIKDWAKKWHGEIKATRDYAQTIMRLCSVYGVIASLEILGEHGLAAFISVLLLGVIATGLLVAWVEVDEEKKDD